MSLFACTIVSAFAHAQQPYVPESTIAGVAEPVAVGFDKDGLLLIAAGREGLLRIEADGARTVLAPGRVDRLPGSATVFADTAHHRVSVRKQNETNIVEGSAWPIGRLLAPEAAAIAPDQSLWIADTGNSRVVRVDATGGAQCFGERGFFPGQFIAPSGIAFDAGGPLITDRLNHRVTRLAWDGSLRDIFGLHALRPREGEGRIHYPNSIAVDSTTGRVAIAEPFERRVQIFRPAQPGDLQKPTPPMPSKEGVSSHFGIDCSVGGDMVAAWEPESGCVVLWDTRIDPPAHVATFGGTGDRPSVFRSLASVLVEPTGAAVWVLDALGDRLERWSLLRDGRDPVQFDPFMARCSAGVPLHVARLEAGISEGVGSDLVWCDGKLGVVFMDGSVAWTDSNLKTFTSDPRAVRPRNDGGALRAATVDNGGRLLLLWSNGVEIRGKGDPIFLPLNHIAKDPRGVIASADGLVISDADQDALIRLNMRGEVGKAMVAPRTDAARFDGKAAAEDGALWLPARLAGGGDGAIFVVDYGNHRLQRFGADGAWQSTFTLSKSRAKERSPPSIAPSAEVVQRENARREQARARTLAGTDTLTLARGAVLCFTAPSPIPLAEPFAMRVCLSDSAGKPLEDVALMVDCSMPHHGHGMNVKPVVASTSPGCFSVEPMLLHMPGRWELAFDLRWPDGRVHRVQCSLEMQ